MLDDPWNKDKLPKDKPEQGKSLFEAAPKGLQNNKDLFDNLFFVAADIPETVFESPTDGTKEKEDDEQTDHALKSGIAALSVMSRRMHVLHAAGTDLALDASREFNNFNGRLGSHGPYDDGKKAKVWEAVSNELEDKESADALYGNVYVEDCKEWNHKADLIIGHSYEAAFESVQYYIKHMGQKGHVDTGEEGSKKQKVA